MSESDGGITGRVRANNEQWNRVYVAYQEDSVMPGVKYPNEHLVRFIAQVTKNAQSGPLDAVELGFGNITNMLMMHDFGCHVHGLEVSQSAVQRARRAISERGLEGVLSVDQFDGVNIPLDDSSVDVLVGLQCVYYNLNQEQFVAECSRVLTPGGVIFLSFFTPAHDYMKFTKGKPGGIVQFDETHPNERLRGLNFFLFKSRDHLKQVYGKHFDLRVGLIESDTLR